MTKPKALILAGDGVNCEEETQYAFKVAGAEADIVHNRDLIAGRKSLDEYQILTLPGGFSFGDDTGSGNGLANRLRNNLWDALTTFVEQDKLVLGICNGFQVLVRLGLVPALEGQYGGQQVALIHNDGAQYIDRWVDLRCSSKSPWLRNIQQLSLPIAHGEGKLYAPAETLKQMQQKELIAARYTFGKMCAYQSSLPVNPNGSLDDIAALTDESGRILGMMPHPERAIAFTHLPDWALQKEKMKRREEPLPKEGPGLQVFKNGVAYFS